MNEGNDIGQKRSKIHKCDNHHLLKFLFLQICSQTFKIALPNNLVTSSAVILSHGLLQTNFKATFSQLQKYLFVLLLKNIHPILSQNNLKIYPLVTCRSIHTLMHTSSVSVFIITNGNVNNTTYYTSTNYYFYIDIIFAHYY